MIFIFLREKQQSKSTWLFVKKQASLFSCLSLCNWSKKMTAVPEPGSIQCYLYGTKSQQQLPQVALYFKVKALQKHREYPINQVTPFE